jgi:hypothetical protein
MVSMRFESMGATIYMLKLIKCLISNLIEN